MAKTEITNGKGLQVHVTPDNELQVIGAPYPPLFEQKVQPFRQYLTDDGLAAGTNNMAVDGSSTNVDYFVQADASNDRYITSLNFIVGYGASGQINQWADGAALTNGSRLFYENRHGEHDIHDGLKSNQNLFRLAFYHVPTVWEHRHLGAANDYGYMISMDLTRMGLPFGIKLDAGSPQRLVMCIRDNTLTSADTFNCIAYGFERFA